jgi:hypothetical protein
MDVHPQVKLLFTIPPVHLGGVLKAIEEHVSKCDECIAHVRQVEGRVMLALQFIEKTEPIPAA